MATMPNSGFYRPALLLAVLFFFSCCDSKESRQPLEVQTGLASFYGEAFEGEETASGETFDPEEFVAAHPRYPAGTVVRVTNLENGRSVNVRIIDRGPTRPNLEEGVIIDLSRQAAEKLAFKKDGRTQVRTEVLQWGG